MPELPEVETIKLSLQSKITNAIITNVQVLNQKSFLGDPQHIQGNKVLNIWRKAKVLGVDLSESNTLLFHLKMSGQVIWKGESVKGGEKRNFVGGHPTKDMLGEMPTIHTRVIFGFNDGSKLYFNDQRKFGWIKLVNSREVADMNYGYAHPLGPEPLDDNFSWQLLKGNLLKHKNTAVKVAILDSSVVAGVGNIYACEACFVVGIDPRTKVGNMGDMEFKTLHEGIIRVLKNGIKYGGSTRAHFVDATGKKGLFLDHANVYNRVGKPCNICGTKIEKIKLGGRGTFFCTKCQN